MTAPRAPSSARAGVVPAGATVGVVWAAALATQYVAARLAYHPHLGPWLYRASAAAQTRLRVAAIGCCVAVIMVLPARRWRWGAVPLGLGALTAFIVRRAPLYSPERILVWYAAYHAIRAYQHLFVVAWLICGVVAVAATIAAMRLAAGDTPMQGAAAARPVSRRMQRLPPPLASHVWGADRWHQRGIDGIASSEVADESGQLDPPLPVEVTPPL